MHISQRRQWRCITQDKISNLIVLIIIPNTWRKIEELLKKKEEKKNKHTYSNNSRLVKWAIFSIEKNSLAIIYLEVVLADNSFNLASLSFSILINRWSWLDKKRKIKIFVLRNAWFTFEFFESILHIVDVNDLFLH